jgi:hypothetical protein
MSAPTTWKKCGHVRVASNTCEVSPSKPGGQCRTCRRATHRTAQARYSRSPRGQRTIAVYECTLVRALARVRDNAKRRGNR